MKLNENKIKKLIKEEIVVTNYQSKKYFDTIKKAINSKRYDIKKLDNENSTIKFDNNLVLLLKSKRNSNNAIIVGYNTVGDEDNFVEIPSKIKKARDLNNFKNLPTNKKVIHYRKIKNVEDLAGNDKDLKGKKYILTDKKKGKLYRIKAIKSFGKVKKGDLGGYIESEDNLSHKGFCWIYDDAQVYGNARVYGNAQVYGNAIVSDDALVYGYAIVSDDAQVYGKAWVFGNAVVYDDAQVYGNARVSGNAQVYGNARVYEDTLVYDNAKIYGNAKVFNDAEVNGKAKVNGDTKVSGNDYIYENSKKKINLRKVIKEELNNLNGIKILNKENKLIIFKDKKEKPHLNDIIDVFNNDLNVKRKWEIKKEINPIIFVFKNNFVRDYARKLINDLIKG